MPSVETQAVAIQKPDWPNIKDEILCPLCDYNVRGLDKPRCPECGYSFEWNDLLDPTRRRHPYLFEHHPHRNFWSFRKTLIGGLRPRVFWKTLHPTQPSRVGRLWLYYFLTALITMLIPVAFMGVGMIYFASVMQQARVTTPPRVAQINGAAFRVSPQQWVAGAYPLPPSAAFFRRYFQSGMRLRSIDLENAATLAGWPLATFVVLQIFASSMRKARVRKAHVLRCVIYGCDFGIWAAMVVVPWVAISFGLGMLTGFNWNTTRYLMLAWYGLASGFPNLFWLAPLLILWYRLGVAYRDYLRFDRPFLTIFASQIIVALIRLNCMHINDLMRAIQKHL